MNGLDQSIDRDNGILDYSRLNDITLQAWSPFQKGFFDGVFLGDRENYARAERRARRARARSTASTPDRHRGRVDHAAPRQHAGRARHDEAASASGSRPPDPTCR